MDFKTTFIISATSGILFIMGLLSNREFWGITEEQDYITYFFAFVIFALPLINWFILDYVSKDIAKSQPIKGGA